MRTVDHHLTHDDVFFLGKQPYAKDKVEMKDKYSVYGCSRGRVCGNPTPKSVSFIGGTFRNDFVPVTLPISRNHIVFLSFIVDILFITKLSNKINEWVATYWSFDSKDTKHCTIFSTNSVHGEKNSPSY